ncbi:hypothetical protein PILCRDRAFT_814882 [Piloderma croceum F 1598]|uniref:Uncharacterized protein n=1 Tax=Piloderma croceum (strain F 1598) TaxID=765440 RepID=A0A0C3G6D7_PILCF|nr:hypothetical protein PILCRDRAFT_814882 [Piloderma croceum F 1598]
MSNASAAISPTILVTINDLKGRKLPKVGTIKRLGKFYVDLVVDGHLKHKTSSAKGDTALWTRNFHFGSDILRSSMLECRVYAKHQIGSDDFIGGTKDMIESLLAEGPVITRELYKHDALGNQHKTQIILEFMISAMPMASDAGLNMEEAVAQGKDALDHMKLMSSSFEPIQGASVTVVTNISSLSDVWAPLLQKVKLFTKFVDTIAQVHPYANMAWSILSAINKTILAQVDRDNFLIRLVEIMDDAYSFVKEAEPTKTIESHRAIIELMAQQTTECAYFIRDYATNKNFWERALRNSFMSDVDSKITQYTDKFKELKMAFQDRAILQTEIIVSRIFGNLECLVVDFDLGDMPYAKGARFDPDKGCLLGTRETIIGEIVHWVNSPNGDDAARVFFLSGVAGSGKSAIAHNIAKLFDQQKRLGSSYCFDRADQVNRRPNNLLSTIALDIADLDHHWKSCLGNAVKGNRSLRTTLSATEQFKKFILEPARALTTVGPILVVVDALDESAEESSRKALLNALAKGISDLPSNFRMLITARPEPDIVDAFDGNQHIFCKYMNTIDEASNETDITLFIETQLSHIGSLELEWPNKLWCRMLTQSSGGLFQWASTACRAIKEGKRSLYPTERLSRFMSSARGLDGLYSEVLRQAFDADDDTVMSRFKLLMGRILATKEPLSVSAHSELRGDDDPAGLVELILPSLASLLSGVNQQHVPVRALHASFFDFLTDRNRSKSYFVDPSQHSHSLMLSSLRVMESGLRFNICNLETSHVRNTDVPDLAARVENTILPHLSYGCRFWADHLITTAYDTEILSKLRDFFHHRFLYWLEVLSLLKKINVASRMLRSMLEWNQNDDDIMSLVTDAKKFVSAFGSPISQSAPHIYLSALPFAPKSSQVAKHYLPLFPKTLYLKTGKVVDWPAIIVALEGHTSWVNSVVFSHDGRHIVSGSSDYTIRVWDAETGETVVGPLEGHTNLVNSVAFSQDNKYIVSGSSDSTIRVWDAETGEAVASPLEGHTGSVNSIAFSHDGKRIVSGSCDQTIRVWDAETGETVVGPLEGHTDLVNSVAFSHNSKLIVSGSRDKTIQVWDAETGEAIARPLEGHTHSIFSIAFSHDSKHIVSGSYDHTIRVWDAKTGEAIVGPLVGHTDSVNSVAFSHDSKLIVSGSSDQTIQIWNAQTGEAVVGSLIGHNGAVSSVAFSHDGKHIVSGSYDNTIRVWDTETGGTFLGPIMGHHYPVKSVAFSHNSMCVVSGSRDKTIRVWDTETGELIVEKGHTDYVNSVAFSHDGKCIVSGSSDHTVHVWDAETGEAVGRPLEGHTDSVNSVAFSHNSKLIVSGSRDQTIRVWDVETGKTIVGPLRGHSDLVNSVTFSHDDKCIVSGSSDHTIRVWDAEMGETVVGPLEGHTDSVNSVAFSQDSKCIVSGSSDHTIRIWVTETGTAVAGPIEGHTGSVNSVAFSHDCKWIVSGSKDQTIRVWDAETRETIVGPLEGHFHWVTSVAFSHDAKHIVSGSWDNTIRVFSVIDDDPPNEFKDGSRLESGWILNHSSAILFWIPPWNRRGLYWPRNSLVIVRDHPTQVDLQNFVYGTSWQECKA